MLLRHRFSAATLALCFAASSVGAATVTESQSPIRIITADAVFSALDPLVFNYGTNVSHSEVNAGAPDPESTVRADFAPGNTLTIGTTTYDLLQFHVHESAEHLIDDFRGDLELHLVHRADNGDLAVVAQILRIGTENTALEAYFDALSSVSSGGTVPVTNFNLAALLPDNLTSYRYSGSLTAPNASNPQEPFFEPIAWNVLAEIGTLSQTQFDQFKALFPDGNARDVQELNGRVVTTDVAPIPIPASGVLFLFALGGLAALRRRAA